MARGRPRGSGNFVISKKKSRIADCSSRDMASKIIYRTLKRIHERSQKGYPLEPEEAKFTLEAYKAIRVSQAVDSGRPMTRLLGISTRRLLDFIQGEVRLRDVTPKDPEEKQVRAKPRASA